MKLQIWAFLVVSCPLLAQESAPSPQIPATGQVTGRVFCGDTDLPGRFAGVQLIAEKPDQLGISDPGVTGKNPDLAKALQVVMGTFLKGSGLSALTGIDGTFSLDKVPPGTYYVVAHLPGYRSPLSQFSQAERMKADAETLKAVQSAAEKIVVQPNQAAHVELRLERGASLDGNIRYDDGSPAPGVTPVLVALEKDGKWKELAIAMLPTPTDDRGHFRLCGLSPGKYAVKAALPTMQASVGLGASSLAMHMNMGDALVVFSGGALREKDIKPIEIGPGEAVDGIDVVFPLSGLHAIAGSIVAKTDNHPFNAGTVALLDSETKASLRTAIIAQDGSFRLNYVPDGQHILQVSDAADTEKTGEFEMESDLARMMNSKTVKSYGEAEMPLIIRAEWRLSYGSLPRLLTPCGC